LFTLFAIVFFLIGVALFGIGLLGEYVGRIYAQVRERPRYIVQAVLEEGGESASMSQPVELPQHGEPAAEFSRRGQAAPR
ncbi:MAG: undecaprenyl-phosphate 4-deoxy-4-formamido-L-arabinose transferase, partial [Gammaproteobacteria bacterium]|jgi:undecaprenyl-phosphate 4-deoxy-4-formamido-L-arabinose transferase|nr:undecaprenyl-phosphate 4-deoxy-4-formamido-L-arabinose transferase [Gammaproteobacteria bacterium]